MQTGRAEHVGADVGDAGGLQRALGHAVLAERTVKRGKATSAPASPPPGVDRNRSPVQLHSPSREITIGITSWPGCPQARGDRLARAQRDVVLAGAAAAEYRDPHQGVGTPPEPVGAVGWKTPTVITIRVPSLTVLPPPGFWSITRPFCGWMSVVCS